MNRPLLKHFVKKSWKTWALFAFVMVLYFVVLVASFTPEMIEYMRQFYPEIASDDIVIFISDMYMPSIATMFPMIFYIIMAHKLVNKTVEDTSLSAHLSASVSRREYILTAGLFFLFSIAGLYLVVLLVGTIMLPLFSSSFIFTRWLNLVVLAMLASLTVGFISFFISSAFAGSKPSLALMIGIPVLFMLMLMIGGAVTEIDFLTWIPPFGWYNAGEVARGAFKAWWWLDLIYICLVSVLFYLSVKIFKKKQLSI